MVDDTFDVVIIGAGSGGVSLAGDLVDAGRTVALVASGYVGGECPYVACMPSKSLLRSARGRDEIRTAREHGAASDAVQPDADDAAWREAVRRRDSVANQRDDSAEADAIADKGITVVRGFGRLLGRGQVAVGDRTLHGTHVVLDTGSTPVVPDIDGLAAVPTWTSDEALSSPERPASLVILGGGPIGCELAQAYARFGADVTVLDPADRLLPTEDEAIGSLMRDVLEASGVHIELGSTPTSASADASGAHLTLDSGATLTAERVLIAVGRRPATDGVEVESAGGSLTDSGAVEVDDHCRAGDGLWAIGDVTGLAPYTHTANHQASVVLDALVGDGTRVVTPDALPRAVYTDPPAAGTGLTESQARERGLRIAVAEVDLASGSRAGAEGEGPLGPQDSSGGLLRLVADADRGVLVGAAAIGPDADSWMTEATLAVRAQIPIAVLAEVVRPFPTFAEAYTLGYRDLLPGVNAR
ncbi:dihydrolipoyl dehydrogenase family protein [uncultured Jatrophihabitans sp.]|uniref:dihydrolipoyl dehydrogenase family protein n=1 Tax=uncultured Jatrophihabitans sp. TaxID=1610747 RepID=UPI0035CB25B8